MKIALIVRHYHKRGGISRCVAALAERFAKSNEVHVFTASWDNMDNSSITFHKVPILSSDFLRKRKLYALNVLLEVCSFVISSYFIVNYDDFDIVHCHGDYIGKCDIYTSHSCHKAWITLAKKSILNPLHMIIVAVEKQNIKHLNKVIAISQGIKNEITSVYKLHDKSRIICIPNGVETNVFNQGNKTTFRNEMRQKHGIKDNSSVIIFPAHEFKRKGLTALLKALQLLNNSNITLLVVGRDNPAPFVHLIGNNKVIFTGEVSDVHKYYAASDIMAFPTKYEPFGLIITEAMALGLPVIVSRLAGASELVTDGKDGILLDDPCDIKEISRKISSLMNDPVLMQTIGQAAIDTSKKYSWDNIARQTYTVYEDIVKQKKALTNQ